MTPYTKPYLTLDQQISLLMSRGMTVTDVDKAKASLSRIGYYRLSAYWYPFRQSISETDAKGKVVVSVLDNFKPNTDFATVHDLYVFDKNLRLIVTDALERVEVALRTDLALLLGKKDPQAHRKVAYLHGNFTKQIKIGHTATKHQEWLIKQDYKFLKSKEEFAKHFKTKYAGEKPPIWIDVEAWDFGALSHFYEGMNVADQDRIGAGYGLPNGRLLRSWLHCLNDVRNNCAHHSRLWNKPLVNRPALPSSGEIPLFDHFLTHGPATTRLYAAVSILNLLVRVINPTSTWRARLATQIASLPVHSTLNLSSAGFPPGWNSQALWL